MILEHSYTKRRFEISENSSKISEYHADPSQENWMESVVDLDLNHQGIRKIQNLER